MCVGVRERFVFAAYRKQKSAETWMVVKNINHTKMNPPAHHPLPPPSLKKKKKKKTDRDALDL